MTVRVRFAPSPTGIFHVGGARSALQNWIFAKQHNGTFTLRIEDTDAARNRPEWVEGILSALDWLGIARGTYEGPYFQSAYAEKQRAAAAHLYEVGQAYYCDCTRDQVAARWAAKAAKPAEAATGQRPTAAKPAEAATSQRPTAAGTQHAGYDGYCRDRGLGPGEGRALRFRTPDEGQTVVEDVVRGKPTFDNKLIEDFVIARADGSPMFLLANVVDDMTMGITHVIRAEEHLPNTPKQQLLWQALGHTPPVWAHVPIVVNEKRQKLSKRRDKVALEAYRDEGYLADAMRNYLMLLGWSPSGDREIVPWSVIEQEFRLEDVNSSPAFFDEKKLRAFNGEYIRALTAEQFVAACRPWLHGTGVSLPPWQPEQFDEAVFAAVAPLAQTRVSVLSEIVPAVDFLFLDEPAIDETSWTKAMKPGAVELLRAAVQAFTETPAWDAATLKATLEALGTAHGLKLGKAQAPVRVAVTGRAVGLPLFESIEALGRERTLARLHAAINRAESELHTS